MLKYNMLKNYKKIIIKILVSFVLIVVIGLILYKLINTLKENFNTINLNDNIELNNFPGAKTIDGENGIFNKEDGIVENNTTYTKYT